MLVMEELTLFFLFFEMYFWSSSYRDADIELVLYINGLQEVHPVGRGKKEESFGEERSPFEMGAEVRSCCKGEG